MIKRMFSTRYELTLVTILTLAFGFEFLDRLAMAFMLPVIQPELGITNQQIGVLGFINTGVYSASAIVFGIIMDRVGGRKRWLTFWMFATFLSTAACTFVTSYEQFLFVRALVGFTEGPLLGLFGALLIHASPKHFGRNYGITNAGVGLIAVTFGPIIVTQLVTYYSWQMTYLLVSIPTLIITIGIVFFVKEIKVDPQEAVRQNELLRDAGGFSALFRNRNVVICTLLGVALFGGYWTLMLFAPLYLVKVAHLTVQQMGWVSSVMGILYIVHCILVPKLSDVYGRRVVIIITAVCCTIGPLLMAVTPGSILSIVAYVLFGGAIPSMVPLVAGVVPMESVVENLRTSAGGWILGVGEFFGGSCMPVVVGKVADLSGLQATMGVGAALLAVNIIGGFGLQESNPAVLVKRGEKALDPELALELAVELAVELAAGEE
jgi:MFS family permease